MLSVSPVVFFDIDAPSSLPSVPSSRLKSCGQEAHPAAVPPESHRGPENMLLDASSTNTPQLCM